jgi:membrane-associated phospholipid phosphatase
LTFIICWSRWRLNMHSLNQLIAGLVLTAILTYLQLEVYPLLIPQLLLGI